MRHSRAAMRQGNKGTSMNDSPIQIKRYPNRRYYARNTSTYVTLQEIEAMIQSGMTVEIRDSQTGEDLTRSVLDPDHRGAATGKDVALSHGHAAPYSPVQRCHVRFSCGTTSDTR